MRIFYFLSAIFPIFSLDGANEKLAKESAIKIADIIDDWFLFAEMSEVELLSHFRNSQRANETVKQISDKLKPENGRDN